MYIFDIAKLPKNAKKVLTVTKIKIKIQKYDSNKYYI